MSRAVTLPATSFEWPIIVMPNKKHKTFQAFYTLANLRTVVQYFTKILNRTNSHHSRIFEERVRKDVKSLCCSNVMFAQKFLSLYIFAEN